MITPVIEKVLGNNRFYTETHVKDTINLVKSILIKNHSEAKTYNDYLLRKYPNYLIEPEVTSWRYYLHLAGLPHDLDKPIQLVSIDNGQTITLSRGEMQIHRRTREELLKFGLYYDEVVARYPDQELFIKAVITDPLYSDIYDIVDLEDFTIVSYNSVHIEENEHDVMPELQARINNYKSIWLIPYYGMANNLFVASQYHILYSFLVTGLLSIRLGNAKTMKAHSYHIQLYLASHHYLDQYMMFLNRKQQLFLYRNLMYLDNHAGMNKTFHTLIDTLFTEHNISVVGYRYNQLNEVDSNFDTKYVYNQELLNGKNLVYRTTDLDISYLKGKEYSLASDNHKEYDYNLDHIDRKNKGALFSTLLTKDLETILVDETDSVKYKLIPTLVDYWAYLIKHNLAGFLVDAIDPVTNVVTRMSVKDLFKFYTICLFKQNHVRIEEFPPYRIKRVFKPELPPSEYLHKLFYRLRIDYKNYIEEIKRAIPAYSYLMTSYQFSEFVSGIYKLNIGLWLLLSNYSDMDTEGQMALAIDELHTSELYEFNDETVADFLTRVGISDPRDYDTDTLTGYLFNLLDNVFDGKLSYLNRLKKLQQALTDVFFKFNSYTVQLINNYYSDSPLLTGLKDTRYSSTYEIDLSVDTTLGDNDLLVDQPSAMIRSIQYVPVNINGFHFYKYHNEVDITVMIGLYVEPVSFFEVNFPLSSELVETAHTEVRLSEEVTMLTRTRVLEHWCKYAYDAFLRSTSDIVTGTMYTVQTGVIVSSSVGFDLENNNWMVSQFSDSDLMFLANHT